MTSLYFEKIRKYNNIVHKISGYTAFDGSTTYSVLNVDTSSTAPFNLSLISF